MCFQSFLRRAFCENREEVTLEEDPGRALEKVSVAVRNLGSRQWSEYVATFLIRLKE